MATSGWNRVMVVGAGRSGLALCRHFRARGAQVRLSDRRSEGEIQHLEELRALGVELDLGGHSEALFLAADLIALSPGVPPEVPAVAAARAAGIPVLGEIELAARQLSAPFIGITGTNGKSTTTTLMGEIFRAWGKRAFVGGNIGVPLTEALAGPAPDYLVVELSSFQLETVERLHPGYALLLNLTQDHLDRYADMHSYIEAKMHLFDRMEGQDVAVLNADDPLVAALAPRIRCRILWFSSTRELERGMGFSGGKIRWRFEGQACDFDPSLLRLRGRHNLENVMAALIPPLLEGCPPQLAFEAARDFGGLPHRMVPVRTLGGVVWYNDSKGTNVGSVVKSLEGLEGPVTLIAGGKDKGGDFSVLEAHVRQRVRHLILIGEAAGRMEKALGHLCDTRVLKALPEAVELAARLTEPGGSVLFSPGGSSFDQYRSFEQRGDHFEALVRALPPLEGR